MFRNAELYRMVKQYARPLWNKRPLRLLINIASRNDFSGEVWLRPRCTRH